MGFPLPSGCCPRVVFQDPIVIDGAAADHALGVFYRCTGTIHMIRFGSRQFQGCGSLGTGASEELCCAILAHELALYLNAHVSPGLVAPID